jgi:hypothetical protein
MSEDHEVVFHEVFQCLKHAGQVVLGRSGCFDHLELAGDETFDERLTIRLLQPTIRNMTKVCSPPPE